MSELCGQTNMPLRLKCTRERGHDGWHWQETPSAYHTWPNHRPDHSGAPSGDADRDESEG